MKLKIKASNTITASRKPKLEVYTPRPRAPGETPGVLIAPMSQPRYVPPRWESAR